jgi:signal peptidase II
LSSKKPDPNWAVFFPIVLLILFLDVLSKEMVVSGQWVGVMIPGLLDFTPVTNPGAAFGLLPGARVFFIGIKIMAALVIVRMVSKSHKGEGSWLLLPLALIMGGALGNLFDRFRGNGEVVDFVDFHIAGHHWYIWNVADAAVSVGAVLVALYLLFANKPERKPALPEE